MIGYVETTFESSLLELCVCLLVLSLFLSTRWFVFHGLRCAYCMINLLIRACLFVSSSYALADSEDAEV